MNLCRLIIAIIPIIFTQLQALSQTPYDPAKDFAAPQLQEDFRVLRKVLEEVHPGLYRYSDKQTIDSLFNTAYSQINKPMTEIEFYRIVNKVVVSIRDEHTFALPSRAYWDTQIGQTVYDNSVDGGKAVFFPFFIKIIDKRLYIDNNLSDDTSLMRGDEITDINGRPAANIIHELLQTIHTNGYIENFRERNLEQFSLHQTYNRFMVHYALFIGMPDTFRLTIKKYPGNQIISLHVASLTSKKIYQYYWRRYSTVNDPKKRKENPYEFKLLNDKAAYLRLSDFHDNAWLKYNYSTSTEFRSVMDVLHTKSITNLVIDLRGNEGGDLGIGMKLLPYLTTTTFQPYLYHEVNNYRYPGIVPYLTDSADFPHYPDELFVQQQNGTFKSNTQYKTENWSRPMQPNSNNYIGHLYVLMNGATGSAASIFATLIRVNRKDAIFIGEESGGDMEGAISGSGTDITLPNTKLRVDISWIKRFTNLNGYPHTKGHGIRPDYAVAPALKDFVANEDTEMKFVLRLIAGKRK